MLRTIAMSVLGVCGAAAMGLCVTGSTVGSETPRKTEKKLRHVVMFKFKEAASDDQIKAIVKAFAALPEKIDAIAEFEHGTDVSVEQKAKGFTHCFIVTFRDEKGRDAYLPHPDHQAFVKQLLPILDDVLVFDYWTGK